jgi:hypothetical protein
MAVSLCGLALLLSGGLAYGQGYVRPADQPPTGEPSLASPDNTLYFSKPVNPPAPLTPPPMPESVPSPSKAPDPLPAVKSQAMPVLVPALEPRPRVAIQPVLLQQPGAVPLTPGEEPTYQIQLEPPSKKRWERVESDASLKVRLQQEYKDKGSTERLEFPEEAPLSLEKYLARNWPCSSLIVEPQYVFYGRMYFEDYNSERYGWDLGFIQPFVSAALFYKDLALLPYHFGSDPCRTYECSAGYCLPGDSVPYLCYPPELSVTGAVTEAVVIGGLLAIFP